MISSEKGIACDKEHEFRELTTLFLIVFQCPEEDDRRFSVGWGSFCDLRFSPNSDPGNNKIYQHCKYAGLNKCPVLKDTSLIVKILELQIDKMHTIIKFYNSRLKN